MERKINTDINCPDDIKIKVIYPHFANTYLLPYYVENKKILGRNASIEVCKWDEGEIINKIKSENENNILIFYGTNNTKRNLPLELKVDCVDFSFYQPRLMFIQFSIELYRNHYVNKELEKYQIIIDAISKENDLNIIPTFEDIKDYLLNYKLHEIIFSDTKEQANYLRNRLKLSKYFSNDKTRPYIKLLYYSAPYTIYLLNQYPEFLPIRLDYKWLNSEKDFKDFFMTYNFIYCKYKTTCNLNKDCILKKYLLDFHIERFFEAREEPKILFDIFLKYVEKNEEQIPFHIFKDVDCFAKAISLHHQYNEDFKYNSSLKLKITNYQNLTNPVKGANFNKFNFLLNKLKENGIALYVLLLYSYIFQRDNGKEDYLFNNIANSLIDRNFLNGKYFFIFRSIINLLYLDFLEKLKIHNLKKLIESEGVTEREVYSIYMSYVFNHVLETIKNINDNISVEFLKIAFKVTLSENLQYDLIPITLEEFNNTIAEISDAKIKVENNYNNYRFFTTKQKESLSSVISPFDRKRK
jgi:hypothetical protein